MKVLITSDDAEDEGISARHERMPNGEKRYRLSSRDGASYIRTEASANGGWQRAHLHERAHETYIIESGWVVLLECGGATCIATKLVPGDVHTVRPGIRHNAYLHGSSVVHAIKHNAGSGSPDWIEAPELQQVVDALPPEVLQGMPVGRTVVSAIG